MSAQSEREAIAKRAFLSSKFRKNPTAYTHVGSCKKKIFRIESMQGVCLFSMSNEKSSY